MNCLRVIPLAFANALWQHGVIKRKDPMTRRAYSTLLLSILALLVPLSSNLRTASLPGTGSLQQKANRLLTVRDDLIYETEKLIRINGQLQEPEKYEQALGKTYHTAGDADDTENFYAWLHHRGSPDDWYWTVTYWHREYGGQCHALQTMLSVYEGLLKKEGFSGHTVPHFLRLSVPAETMRAIQRPLPAVTMKKTSNLPLAADRTRCP
ncbi:MAG: hypothetical protein JWM56_541 [Candidatus Peribacteria bacterium]|nr:hypothetical protein [Candidatus Peribacteria bacterium]